VTTWAPKLGPWWTQGRWVHGFIGFVIPVAAHAVWGYPGLGWASVAVLVGSCAWELLTPRLARWRRWGWPFGDVVDLAAFVTGWLVAVVVCVR
jgi:membrane protein YdbS with pleckstrin-like domain